MYDELGRGVVEKDYQHVWLRVKLEKKKKEKKKKEEEEEQKTLDGLQKKKRGQTGKKHLH